MKINGGQGGLHSGKYHKYYYYYYSAFHQVLPLMTGQFWVMWHLQILSLRMHENKLL